MTTLEKKQIDNEVERLYYTHAGGKSINVMDIGKIFKAGRDAYHAGESVEDAIVKAIAVYCS